MKTKTLEVWVVVDADGDYAVGTDEETACDAFDSEVGGNHGRRVVKMSVTVPLPAVIELTGEVPAEPEPAALKVV